MWMWHDTFIWDMMHDALRQFDSSLPTFWCVTWHVQMWHDSLHVIYTFIWDMTHDALRPLDGASSLFGAWRGTFIRVKCDVTYSCVTWLIHVWYGLFVTHSYVSNVTWPIHVWQDSFMWNRTYSCVTGMMHAQSRRVYMYMGWLRLVGSFLKI